MNKSISTLLIALIMLISQYQCAGQDDDRPNIFEKEICSIEPGIGLQYGVIGLRGKYFFSEYVGTSLGLGTIGIGLVWNASLELRVPNALSNRISPFINIMYGINAGSKITTPGGDIQTAHFKGFSSSIGLKINFIEKWNTYFSIGTNYRLISEVSSKYFEQFNKQYGTDYEVEYGNFFPFIGLSFLLNK